jgi:hypothetical protein
MTDLHERARKLIALAGSEEITGVEQEWLASHLDSCVACQSFAENSRETIRALRAIPITAGAGLVSATQMRVRQRGLELQRRQERVWVISICCAAVALSSALTTAALWRGFAWLGQQSRLAAPVWEAGFVVVCLMPAVLAGVSLLARGTCLADRNGRGWE